MSGGKGGGGMVIMSFPGGKWMVGVGEQGMRERAWMQHLKRHDIHPSHLIHLQKKPCTTWKTLISWYGCHLSISEYLFTILSPDWLSSYHGPRLTSSSSYKGRASGIGILPKYCQSWVKRCWCSSCGTKVWHQRCKVLGIAAVDMGRAWGDMGSQYSEEKRTFWLDVRWTLNTPTRHAWFGWHHVPAEIEWNELHQRVRDLFGIVVGMG